MKRVIGLLAVAGALLPRPGQAACKVDSVSTKVHLTKGTRTDELRLYVDSGAVDCGELRLSWPGMGEVLSAKAKVVRGDAPSEKFGVEHLVWNAEDGLLVARYVLPGLRQRDIVVLKVSRALGDTMVWQPAAWGIAGWAELKVQGDGEPTLSEVEFDGRSWFVEGKIVEAAGGQMTVRFGPEPPPLPGWSHDGVAKLKVVLKPEADVPAGEPPLGQTAVTWSLPIGPSGAHAVPWPADSTERSCQILGSADALIVPTDHGCAITEAKAGTTLVAQWTIPRVMLAGELGPQSRGLSSTPLQYDAFSPTLSRIDSHPTTTWAASVASSPSTSAWAPTGRVDVEVVGNGLSLRGDVRDRGRPTASSGEGSLKLSLPASSGGGDSAVPPHLGWWVTAVHGQPMLSDRDAMVDVVARTALAASLPEPGLPARLRLRSGESESVPELRRLVRSQVRTGQLPHQRSLQPRRLLHVRKSSYATEWEQALITARYLRQLRLDAVPMPVRVQGHSKHDPALPGGFDHAVVRLRLPEVDGDTWLDPACPVCDLGELRPELWGGQVLDTTLMTLPEAPGGQLIEAVQTAEDGAETVTFTFSGDAALSLRRWLLRWPTTERGAALAELLDGEVTDHKGLGQPGADVVVVVERSGLFDERPPQERFEIPDGEVLRLPWTGTRVRQLRIAPGAPEVMLAGAAEAKVDGAGLSWSRTVGIEADGSRVVHEELVIERGVVLRDDLLALRERMKPPAVVTLEPPAAAPPAEAPPPEDPPAAE